MASQEDTRGSTPSSLESRDGLPMAKKTITPPMGHSRSESSSSASNLPRPSLFHLKTDDLPTQKNNSSNKMIVSPSGRLRLPISVLSKSIPISAFGQLERGTSRYIGSRGQQSPEYAFDTAHPTTSMLTSANTVDTFTELLTAAPRSSSVKSVPPSIVFTPNASTMLSPDAKYQSEVIAWIPRKPQDLRMRTVIARSENTSLDAALCSTPPMATKQIRTSSSSCSMSNPISTISANTSFEDNCMVKGHKNVMGLDELKQRLIQRKLAEEVKVIKEGEEEEEGQNCKEVMSDPVEKVPVGKDDTMEATVPIAEFRVLPLMQIPTELKNHTKLCPTMTDEKSIHPLQHKWTLYYDYQRPGNHAAPPSRGQQSEYAESVTLLSNDSNSMIGLSVSAAYRQQEEYEDRLKILGEYSTVQGFAATFDQLKDARRWTPSRSPMGSNFHLFKESIKPMYEDSSNENGGRWTLMLQDRRTSDLAWQYLLLALVGETLDPDDEICGAVVSLRQKMVRIQLWVRSKEDVQKLNRIGREMLEIMEIPDGVKYGFEFQYNDNGATPRRAGFLSIGSGAIWKGRSGTNVRAQASATDAAGPAVSRISPRPQHAIPGPPPGLGFAGGNRSSMISIKSTQPQSKSGCVPVKGW